MIDGILVKLCCDVISNPNLSGKILIKQSID